MDKMFFQHVKFENGAVATIAVRTSDYDADSACAGFAFCSPDDQFSRRKGRLIAAGRCNLVQKSLCQGETHNAAIFVVKDGRQNTLLRAARSYLGMNRGHFPCKEWADESFNEFVSVLEQGENHSE